MSQDLDEALRTERLTSYARLRGGFPLPLAGTLYWAALGVLGLFVPLRTWCLLAFIASGLIFPTAIGLARLFRNGFMQDRTAVTGLLAPALIGMLLFWPMAIAAFWTEPSLVPLILAIGMSMHWPVVGWIYARVAVYAAHALVRGAAVFGLWLALPDQRTVAIPFAVAAIYLTTVLVLYADSGRVRKALAG